MVLWWWMMKTHWRAQSQRSHSGDLTLRTKYDSLVTMNEHAEALHSSTTSVRRNAASTSYYSVIWCMYTSSSDGFSVCRCCQDINAGLHIQSIGLMQRTAVWRVWRADVSSTIGPERRCATCNRRAAAWQHHADWFYDSSTGYPCVNEWPSRYRRPGLPVFDWPCTGVSGRRLSAYFRRQHAPTPIDQHSDVRRPTFK